MKVCSIEGCEQKVSARGYCNKHYIRFKKHGNPKKTLFEVHNMHGSPEYKSWQSMKERCLSPSSTSYKNYGKRGITIFQEWIDSFSSFFNYIGLKPSETHSIDRIDNNGNYEPGNVKWSDKKDQSRNQRKSSRNKSGTRGVSFNTKVEKWVVSISTDNGRIFLGQFKNLKEAAFVRREAEKKYWN